MSDNKEDFCSLAESMGENPQDLAGSYLRWCDKNGFDAINGVTEGLQIMQERNITILQYEKWCEENEINPYIRETGGCGYVQVFMMSHGFEAGRLVKKNEHGVYEPITGEPKDDILIIQSVTQNSFSGWIRFL